MTSLSDTQLQQLSDGIQSWIARLSSYLSSTTAAQSLPLLGNLATFVADEEGNLTSFGSTLSASITKAINTLQSPTTDEVSALVNSAFQQARIPVQLIFTNANGGGVGFSINASLDAHQTLPLASNLGLGTLVSLSTTGSLNAGVNADLTLTGGVDSLGFYLNTSPSLSSVVLRADASLKSASLDGMVGLVHSSIAVSTADLNAAINLRLGSTDSLSGGIVRFGGSSPANSLTITPSLGGALTLNAKLAASIDSTVNGTHVNLLPFSSQLGVSWNLGEQSSPSIALTHNQLALGPVFQAGGIIPTILNSVVQIADTLAPALKSLNETIPGSGSPGITLLHSGLSASTLSPSQITFIEEGVNELINISSYLKNLPSVSPTDVLSLPDYMITGSQADSSLVGRTLTAGGLPAINEVATSLAAIPGDVSAFIQTLTGKLSALGFSLPILTDPGALAGLLIGQNTDLARLTLPETTQSFALKTDPWKVQIPTIGTLPVSLQAAVSGGISANLGIAYDATGILEYQSSKKRADLLDGIYLYNSTGTGAVLSASLSAGTSANLDFGVVTGTISGSASLGAAVYINADSLGQAHPFRHGVLDTSSLGAFSANAWIGGSVTAEGTIGTVPFNIPIVPNLVVLDYTAPMGAIVRGPALTLAGGNLQLNVGLNTSLSGNYSLPADGDTLSIGHYAQKDAIETVGIDLNRSPSKLYKVHGHMVASLDSGRITITEGPKVISPLALQGGNADLLWTGGAGNDTLVLGNGNNTLRPGTGHDRITLGSGTNLVILGSGKDTITGGSGTTVQFTTHTVNGIPSGVSVNLTTGHIGGGAGLGDSLSGIANINGTSVSDTIHGGVSPCTLTGMAGNDYLSAGSGNATLTGVNPLSATPGHGEVDVMTGGTGSDLFILGSAASTYYLSGQVRGYGQSDYALIQNYNPDTGKDSLQLHGSSNNYVTAVKSLFGHQGVAVYYNATGGTAVTNSSDLVALIQPDATHSLNQLLAANPVANAHFV